MSSLSQLFFRMLNFLLVKYLVKNNEIFLIQTELMVENIRDAFKDSLPANEWMDEVTKDKAEVKADAIQPIIAYPDYIIDENDTKMDDDYEGSL